MSSIYKKVLQKHLAAYIPSPEDAQYETYVDEKGKARRKKRAAPLGLSQRDIAILKKVRKRAHRLDEGMPCICTRVGWTFFIGLIPLVGDVADLLLNNLLVLRKARQAELPGWLLREMAFNNAVSGVANFLPGVGEVIVALYKANSRNAALLEGYLTLRGQEYMRMQGIEVPGKAPTKKSLEEIRPGAGKKEKEFLCCNLQLGPTVHVSIPS
ncbi:putative Genomic scaffold, msy-sf-3 protein [Mycena kentingensis (nom. inval.)]|nr:putative Genomic scaffold, msy-sf-3 protein [Mycena kentingensis (nom. inval.)]